MINHPDLSKFSFEEFVCGESNQKAFLAAKEFSGLSATKNLLIISADIGQGKTHLAVAIGNRLLKETPNLSVSYNTGSQFRTLVQDFLRINQIDVFSQSCAGADALLLDDFQDLAGDKTALLTFKALCTQLLDANRRVVVTVDEDISKYPLLSELLNSHPMTACAVSIASPCIETRCASLHNANMACGQILSYDIVKYISTMETFSLKEALGYLTSLVAYSSHTKIKLTVTDVERIFHEAGIA